MRPITRQPRVCVVGSVNVDIVHSLKEIPRPGETVASVRTAMHAGGKGLNQAIAAQRSGVSTVLIASMGTDERSRVALDALGASGVDQSGVRRVQGPSGTATIMVDQRGENAIVVEAGANAALLHLADADIEALSASDVVMCQFEVPLSVVVEAAAASRAAGATFILNPTPARAIPAELLDLVDVLVVNEHEAERLAVDQADLNCVITTRGEAGARVRLRNHADIHLPARSTTVVDATGAGDTFVGALAAELALGAPMVAASRRAVVAASLAVEREGASPSIPTRADVDAAIRASIPSARG